MSNLITTVPAPDKRPTWFSADEIYLLRLLAKNKEKLFELNEITEEEDKPELANQEVIL